MHGALDIERKKPGSRMGERKPSVKDKRSLSIGAGSKSAFPHSILFNQGDGEGDAGELQQRSFTCLRLIVLVGADQTSSGPFPGRGGPRKRWPDAAPPKWPPRVSSP